MILQRFPGLAANDDTMRCFGAQNVVVYARATDVSFAEHTAPLSIKATLKGREIYELDGQPYVVDESRYLVINYDQPYASHIHSTEETESFCVFFRTSLAAEALQALTLSAETCLERDAGTAIVFGPHLHAHDHLVSPALQRLHAGIATGTATPLWLEEQFHHLIGGLLGLQEEVQDRMRRLPALRATTRIELYRRLHRAKDYLESCYDEPLSLAVLARIACLSEYHFLRQFKLAFHHTPHQYLTQLRLQKALQMLRDANYSVTETFLSVGFENASSFARLFKRHFGLTPQQAAQLSRAEISNFGKARTPSALP